MIPATERLKQENLRVSVAWITETLRPCGREKENWGEEEKEKGKAGETGTEKDAWVHGK